MTMYKRDLFIPLTLASVSYLFVELRPWAYAIWLLFLIFEALNSKLYRNLLFVLPLISLTLYNVSAYYTMLLGITYLEIPDHIIQIATFGSIMVIMSIYVFVSLVLIRTQFARIPDLRRLARSQISSIPRGVVLFLVFTVSAASFFSWYQMVWEFGLSALLKDPRPVAVYFYGTKYYYYQLVAVPISILLVLRLIVKRDSFERALISIGMFAFWIPFLMIGARKEIFLVIVAVLSFSSLPRSRKMLIGGIGALIFLVVALTRSGGIGSIILAFHEYITPQYTQFIVYLADANIRTLLLAHSSYLSGIEVFLPSALRPAPFIPLGESFYYNYLSSFGNTAFAANPIGEAVLNFGALGYVFFLLVYVTLVHFVYRRARRGNVPFVLVGCPYLILFGRSDLWVTVFFVVYSYLILSTIVRFSGKGLAIKP